MENELETGGLYRHFKSGRYKVIGVAKHSETLKEPVIYAATESPQKLWAGPKAMFLGYIERGGVKVPRFAPVLQ